LVELGRERPEAALSLCGARIGISQALLHLEHFLSDGVFTPSALRTARPGTGDGSAVMGFSPSLVEESRTVTAERGSRSLLVLRDRVGANPFPAVEDLQQRVSYPGVELGPGIGAQLRSGLLRLHGRSVGPVGRHGVVGVTRKHDPAGDGDLLRPSGHRGSTAVPALVLPANGRSQVCEGFDRGHDLLPNRRMLAHAFRLVVVEPAGVLEDGVRDPDLPDVVQQGDLLDFEKLCAWEIEFPRNRPRQLDHSLRAPSHPKARSQGAASVALGSAEPKIVVSRDPASRRVGFAVA
jgi:hypothetical protein